MDAKLIVVGGKANKSEVQLKLPSTVGRSRSADLTVAHPKVSRQHCEIFERDGMLVVRDNGSLNGTYIEDNRISESVLQPGQKLTVGPLTFVAAYEPETADAGMMPTVDLPTSLFEDSPVELENQPVPAEPAEPELDPLDFGTDDDMADDDMAAEAWPSLPDPVAEPEFSGATPLVPPKAEDGYMAPPTVAFGEPGDPPFVPPPAQAGDFRWLESPDMMETVPVESEMPPGSANAPQAADPTIDFPPATIELSSSERSVSADPPLSVDDFRSPPAADDRAANNGAIAPPEQRATPDSNSDDDSFPWSTGDRIAETDAAAFVETIASNPSDGTTKVEAIIPPIVTDAATCSNSPTASTSPLPTQSSNLRKPARTGWWPFGNKKPASAKSAAPSPAAEAPVDQEAALELPAEDASLHTEILPQAAAEPAEVSFEPLADQELPNEQQPAAQSAESRPDEDELNQFLKSLGN